MEETVLTNRELVALIILVVLFGFVLTRPGRYEVLESVRGVLKSLTKPMILIPLLLYIGWISASVAGASGLGLWDLGLLKTTILWLLLSGLALVMGLNDAMKKPGFFRGALIKTLSVVAVVEFVVGLKSFPLWFELPGLALAVLLAMTAVAAGSDPKYGSVRKFANGYLTMFVFAALLWSIRHLVSHWSDLDQGRFLREFLLPIWLTPLALLFVYAFALVAAYQSSFSRMRIWNREGPLLRQRLAVLLRAHGRLGHLRQLSRLGDQRVSKTESFREAWREIGALRREAREGAVEDDTARSLILANTGDIGTDDSGKQLDKLKFEDIVASGIAAPFNTSLRLAMSQESLLTSAAEELDGTQEEIEAMHRRLKGSHEAFEWLGPIGTANLIRLLAQRARAPGEIEVMALPIAMLLAIFEPESVEELVEKFDRLLRLAGEPANRAMNIADTLTAATRAGSATFDEMLDAMIAVYQT